MNTPNQYYNEAWEVLCQHFKQVDGLPTPNLGLMTGYPKTRHQWLQIYPALIEVLTIGRRNRWLTEHQNRKGRLAFLIHKEAHDA